MLPVILTPSYHRTICVPLKAPLSNMWLLHTRTLKLHYFVSPEAADEGYAILSHVWDAEEQTFQDLRDIHARCTTTGEDPHLLVSPKIKQCCQVASRHGYRWAWIDTCCIDKTSSAELSEAINSMFQYYTLALVCYAYLRDVPTKGAFAIENRPVGWNNNPERTVFAWSKWHTRGWTLQELLAPQILLFLSDSWEFLGSRADLADKLEEITQIPASILRLEKSPSEMSIAQRMSWAASRQTTRVEDEAYSLLGIFDVNMPTLYGEGRKAFQRLQEEIMKQSSDTTLFAWGNSTLLDALAWYTQDAQPLLFATKPSDFAKCSQITYLPRETDTRREGIFRVSLGQTWST